MPFTTHHIHINPNGPNQQKTTCPQCSHDRKKKHEKCLSVNLEKGLWHCHHCSWSGSLQPKQQQQQQLQAWEPEAEQPPRYQLTLRPFTQADLAYWQPYHISESLLRRYQVYSVAHYASTNQQGKAYHIEASPQNPIFAYQLTGNKDQETASNQQGAKDHEQESPDSLAQAYEQPISLRNRQPITDHRSGKTDAPAFKLYRPLARRNRFCHLGTRPKAFTFGYAQLPDSGPLLLLTGGEKDVLTFAYLGQPAISLNSETAWPSQALIQALQARFQTLAICYDRDETGQRMAQKISQHHGLAVLDLPPMQPGHTDISDYLAHDYPLEPLLARLQALPAQRPLQREESPPIPPTQPMTQLLHRYSREPQSPMVYPGLPPVAMGYVVGPPKSGKTTFCEGLAFSLAAGADSYLGQPLQLTNRKVILFSLEEFWRNRLQRNQQQIQRLLPQHGEAWLSEQIRSIDETFPRNLLSQEDWDLLSQQIATHRPGVVFIDSLSRLYSGSIEDSRVAQALTSRLRQLVQDFQLLLILIHHTPKQLGRPLTIDSIAGSRLLAQEADFALGLSKTPSGQRYLKPIFYRYAPEPEDVQLLQFTEDLWLEVTGTVSEAELLQQDDPAADSLLQEEVLDHIRSHCQQHGQIQTRDLIQTFVQPGELAKASLYRYLRRWQQQGILQKPQHGTYALSPTEGK